MAFGRYSVSGKRCKLLSGIWGGVSAEIEFSEFQLCILKSGGNSFNEIPGNQLTKFSPV